MLVKSGSGSERNMPRDQLPLGACPNIQHKLGSLDKVVTLELQLSHLSLGTFHTPPQHQFSSLHRRLLSTFYFGTP